jgi:putative transposase
MRRAYKYRIYPTKTQEKILITNLRLCCNLYNVSLQHRRDVYKSIQRSVSYKEQANELPLIKTEFPEYNNIHSQVLQDVLKRVEKSYKGFFSRIKSKSDKAGFPRFKSKDRFDSFTFPQSGYKICAGNKRIKLSQIGDVKIKFHRQIPEAAVIKTCTIKREGSNHWYCVLSCDIPIKVIEKKSVSSPIGIDLGLTDFVFLSDGTKIKNPKHLRKSEERLKEIQSEYSLSKTKSNKRMLIGLHRKITNQRNDFLHKTSRQLVNTYDLIAYEDLKIKKMIISAVNDDDPRKQRLPKHIHDASWGKFIAMIKYKAEEAGTYAIAVNPKNTSQKCSGCGTLIPKDLYERTHSCHICGLSVHRDYNSALNILASGTDAHFLEAPSSLDKG